MSVERRDFAPCPHCGRADLAELLSRLIATNQAALEAARVTPGELQAFHRGPFAQLDLRLRSAYVTDRVNLAYWALAQLAALAPEIEALRDPTDPDPTSSEPLVEVLAPGVFKLPT